MSDTGYLYPEWHRARRSLIEALVRECRRHPAEPQIAQIVTAWFQQHMFQLGCEVMTSREMAERYPGDIEKETKHRAARMLADKLLELGLYSTEGWFPDHPLKCTQYRVMAFGSQPFVGQGTREEASAPPAREEEKK